MAAAERDLSMTDIINQAITMWLDGEFDRSADNVMAYGPIHDAIDVLRKAKPEARTSLVRNVSKQRVVEIGKGMGIKSDTRFSQAVLIDNLLTTLEN
jgi:hypothetical protein